MSEREAFKTCLCCACIPTNTTGILERFGKFIKTMQPGLNFFCCCWEKIYNVPNYVQQLENETTTKTKDDVNITLVTSVQFQIKTENTKDAFYTLQNAKKQIESYIDQTIRGFVPNLTLDKVFQSKDEIGNAVKEELSHVMKGYGFDIINTLLTNIILPPKVLEAMNSKNENLQLRLATVEKAEAIKIEIVTKAEAEKLAIITKAQADSEKIMLLAKAQLQADNMKGEGIAKQRIELSKGLETSVNIIKDKLGTTSHDTMNYVLTSQYIDTLNTIGTSSKNTTMVPFANNPTEAFRNVMVQSDLLKNN